MKRRSCGIVISTCLCLLIVGAFWISGTKGYCRKKKDRRVKYPLTIGVLVGSGSSNFTMQKTLQENLGFTGEVRKCFDEPHFVVLDVNATLGIMKHGWKKIYQGVKEAELQQGADPTKKLSMIIGPFYMNLAMILEEHFIPYLVTDYKGFDKIDMSRVEDRTSWETLVELRPSAQEQNLAVVDLFKVQKWMSAVMVMPHSEADNQECQDLAQQMVASGVSLIPYSVEPNSPNVNKITKAIIRNSQLLNQKQIVVCSPRDAKDKLIERVLKVAKMYGLLRHTDQTFILVDSSSNLAPLAGADQIYRLGLFSARCQLLAFRYFKPDGGQTVDNANVAIAKDAASVTTDALHDYLSKQRRPKDEFDGKRFMKALRKVEIPGETGYIRFNSTGQRINFTLHLYNHGGEDMYEKIGIWTPSGHNAGERLNMTTGDNGDDAFSSQSGIFPGEVKVVVVHEEPFVMVKKNGSSVNTEGNDRYEGFTIDLLKELAKRLNFQYVIYDSPQNGYGVGKEDGSWDGMVGEILAGNATLAMGAISITSQRESVIDFSHGIISTGLNILIAKPQVEYNIFQFLKPFSPYLWLAIIGATVFVSFVFFVLDYTNSDRKFTPKETMWYAVGTLLKRGTDFSPKPVSQRVLTAGFTFFVLITASTYTANMAAFLTTKSLQKSIDTFEDLAESDMGVCTVDKSAIMKFLQRKESPLFERLWDKVGSDDLVTTSSEGRERVEAKECAFLFDYLINLYSEFKYCKTKSVASPILIQEHGIGMTPHAPFKTKINIELLNLKEEGQIVELKKKWWDDKRQCDVVKKRAARARFGLDHTAGVFILALFGLVLSGTFFLSKRCHTTRKMKRQAQKAEKEKELLCQGSPPSSSSSPEAHVKTGEK